MNLTSIWQVINGWDGAVTKFLNIGISSPLLDKLMIFFTLLGNGVSAGLILALVLLLNPETKKIFWQNFGKGAVALLLAGLFVQLLKLGVNRHRPLEHIAGLRVVWEMAIWRSFPSGHTATAFALAGYLSFKIKKYHAVLWTLAALIGISRVYIGVHYPTDVFAGAVIGIIASKIVRLIFKDKNFTDGDTATDKSSAV